TQTVATLHPPKIFGEVCILMPDGGEALGTVTADTLVETVSISKYVVQTFDITDAFLEGVRKKVSPYPEDINLAKVIEIEVWWSGKRRELVLEALTGPPAGERAGKNKRLIRKKPLRPATSGGIRP
ncbi:unnamed protein product, partial [Discosporangium mesarthrocarpum]